MTTRGIRNNNPGNLDRGQPWQGLAKPEEMTPEQRAETRFAVFTAPEWGIRAMARVLQTYRTKYGLDTVAGIIRRWAPPVENQTTAYINAVAASLHVEPDTVLDTSNPDVLRPLIKAIIQHENGKQPYGDAVIMAGIRLAGLGGGNSGPVSRDRESVVQSKTVQGSLVQIATAGGGAVTAMFQLEGPALYFALGLAAIVTVTAIVVFRERILKWADGVR